MSKAENDETIDAVMTDVDEPSPANGDGDGVITIPTTKNNINPDNDNSSREQQKIEFNKKVMNYLSAKYSRRPEVPTTYVAPSLTDYAHTVFDFVGTNNNNNNNTQKIYLGSKGAVGKKQLQTLLDAGVSGIVNCTKRVESCHRPQIKYCEVAVNDEEGADILTYLEGAANFMHYILTTDNNENNQKGSVLVHCEQGISRSSTVVIAYLMKHHGMTRDEAYVAIKHRRPIVNPNQGFWEQLNQFEVQLKNEDNNNMISTMVTIDKTWAERSSALFSTCREIPSTTLQDSIYFQCILLPNNKMNDNKNHVSQVLFVALDFLWSRGILNVDLEWFQFVCQLLLQQKEQHGQGIQQNNNNDENTIVAAVQQMLTSESDFTDAWSGEIYPSQIEKVLSFLKN